MDLHSNRIGKPPEKLLALVYLICVGLLAALAAGAFRMNDAVLRVPAIALIAVLTFGLFVYWMRPQRP